MPNIDHHHKKMLRASEEKLGLNHAHPPRDTLTLEQRLIAVTYCLVHETSYYTNDEDIKATLDNDEQAQP
jgi:hypothetical protein